MAEFREISSVEEFVEKAVIYEQQEDSEPEPELS